MTKPRAMRFQFSWARFSSLEPFARHRGLGGVKECVLYERSELENQKVCLVIEKKGSIESESGERYRMSVCVRSLSCPEKTLDP